MRYLAALIALAAPAVVLLVPSFASATDVNGCLPPWADTICAYNFYSVANDDPQCNGNGSLREGSDGASAEVPLVGTAYVYGYDYCYRHATQTGYFRAQGSGISLGATTGNETAALDWQTDSSETESGSDHACTMVVTVDAAPDDVGCRAGDPPDPGWGSLLP